MDHETLSGIPVTPWILTTIAKANAHADHSVAYWRQAWEDTYYDLGGTSDSVARKGCPMKSAYGLWQSGRIVGHDQPHTTMSVGEVRERYGKNAAYAHLALDLLESGRKFHNASSLWTAVQEKFRHTVGEEPAISEQGAIRIAKALHGAGLAQ